MNHLEIKEEVSLQDANQQQEPNQNEGIQDFEQNMNQRQTNFNLNQNQQNQNHMQMTNENSPGQMNFEEGQMVNENKYYQSPQQKQFQYPQNREKISQEKLKQQHFLLRQMPLHRAPWNERFYISTVQNTPKTHQFFKEYFDKPMRQGIDHMIQPSKPDIPIEEFYRSSSLAQLLYDTSRKNRKIKRRDIIQENLRASLDNKQPSQEAFNTPDRLESQMTINSHSQKNLIVRELNWVDKFGVMSSKNNVRVHRNFREFFDKPIDYDPRGYLYSRAQQPMQVYDRMTPIVSAQKSLSSSQSQRIGFLRANSLGEQRVSKTSQGFRTIKNIQNMKSNTGTNFYQTTSTKSSLSHRMRSSQRSWNSRIGLPISSYNEKVFPKYRILFNNL